MKAESREKEKNPTLIAEQSSNYSNYLDLKRDTPD